ncbi:MAG: Cys-tRNA(Pro) deacylase [Candidatus Latescibacteria bacterium]|jgi:Cys-tRNA(Pro)/Cys-tRNA(Cys) deacylase|nr:Cys-tRNA(Pro) deacylase [Candidatus Latescibacterota bacterium]MBT4141179.1 Cys-tRNA(Pro) deacylase [Candidatus Latescibacterota bacterium]MBT5832474.1 Cys-tRNA(Pro) deacylase [Candidatus Latescibacterota bacterium]
MAKTNAMRILDRLKISYEIKTYTVEESNLSAEHVADLINMPAEQVFKTLVARTGKRDIALACIPGDSELNTKTLGAVAGGKKADLVALKEVQSLTGYIRGGVSPLGTKKPLPVYLDQSAQQWPIISISAGQRGTQIIIAPNDLIHATQAILCDITK